MTRVKGLVFASLFVLALSAQPVLSQDRNGDAPPPPPSRGINTDAPPNPQNNPTAKPPRRHGDGDHRRSRYKPDGDSGSQTRNNDQSNSNGANGQQSGRRRGPPPGPPPANQSAPQGTGLGGHADDHG